MKVLPDISVWSLALRRSKSAKLKSNEQRLADQLVQAVSDGRAVVIGPIRQEVLSGIKERAQFENVRAKLEPFRDESIDTEDYVYAAELYNECRRRGVTGGIVDLLICSVAIRRRWGVLSSDAGLNHCLQIASEFHLRSSDADAAQHRKI